jgi:osmotically-inducible protein OsmY
MSPEILAQLEKSEKLMKAVEQSLSDAALGITEISVAADASGQVALSSIVASDAVRAQADKMARLVPGVRLVLNGLTVA